MKPICNIRRCLIDTGLIKRKSSTFKMADVEITRLKEENTSLRRLLMEYNAQIVRYEEKKLRN